MFFFNGGLPASINMDRLRADTDCDAIEKNIRNILSCRIESEFDRQHVNVDLVVKLFQMAQISIEYLVQTRHRAIVELRLCRETVDTKVLVRQKKSKKKKTKKTKNKQKQTKNVAVFSLTSLGAERGHQRQGRTDEKVQRAEKGEQTIVVGHCGLFQSKFSLFFFGTATKSRTLVPRRSVRSVRKRSSAANF